MADQIPESDLTSDDKLWALLSWLFWPIAIVVLLMEDKKNRKFIKYHAINSLAFGVIASVVFGIIGAITLGIGACLGIIPWAVSIYWGIKAYQGDWVKVPVITDFVKNQGWI